MAKRARATHGWVLLVGDSDIAAAKVVCVKCVCDGICVYVGVCELLLIWSREEGKRVQGWLSLVVITECGKSARCVQS
jgi:hypothetical protein